MIDKDLVRRALTSIQRRSEYEYFFSKLSSGAWIIPLHEEGYFSEPPSALQEGDYIRFPGWPEGEYLARVAADAPDAAAKVLATIPSTDNARVHSSLIDVALSIDPVDAARWANEETRWVIAQSFLPFLLPEKLGELAAHLARKGQGKAAVELSRALLEVLPDTKSGEADRAYRLPPQPRAKFDAWEYARTLGVVVPALADAVGAEALDLLSDLLEEALGLSSLEKSQGPHDYSYIWRDAIESGDDDNRDIRDALVTGVRDAATRLAAISGCESMVASLQARNWTVFRRVALHVARVTCADNSQLVRDLLASRELFDDVTVYHEYAMLARDRFKELSDKERETWLSWIDAGKDRDGMRRRHREGVGEELAPSVEKDWNEQWQRDRLSPIRDSLSQAWRDRFDELVRRHGPPEFDFALHKMSVGWGVPSPITREELSKLNPVEVTNYLAEWVPTGSDFRAPSVEGLVGTLRSMDEDFFVRQAAEAEKWTALKPAYIAALLSGVERAIKADRQVAWAPLLELADRVLAVKNADNEWPWVRRSLADLLVASFDSDRASPSLLEKERLWNVLSRLADLALIEKNEQPVSGDVDSLTVAINSFSGRVLEAMIRYAVWAKKNATAVKEEWHFEDELPDLAKLLDKWVHPDAIALTDARAILGLQLGPLMWLDRTWVVKRREFFFPRSAKYEKHRNAVWNTYLIYGRPLGPAFEDFREEYSRSISQLSGTKQPLETRRDANQHLAEHLMTYYWQGYIPRDSHDRLLERFFEFAGAKLRADAIEFIGRNLKQSDDIPPQPIRLLQELFEWRLEESRGSPGDASNSHEEIVPFGWWIAADKFDSQWSLNHLIEVLQLAGHCEPDHLVAEQLVKWVESDPLTTGRALRMMIEGMVPVYSFVGWRDQASRILELLLVSLNEEARQEARYTINALIERRFIEFRALLFRESREFS